jgi:ATP-dependent DNA helicase DinG
VTELLALFSAEGALAQQLHGFAPRHEQQAMASAIAEAIEERAHLLVEAGTGVGKTFAYLAPALLCGRKVIVSTGTRNLQDQVFARDLPLLRAALGSTSRVALLKGRSNYLCLHRLDLARTGSGDHRGEPPSLGRVVQWAARTRTGDAAELAELPEDDPLWSEVTSTSDNCLGAECPRLRDCHLMAARRTALEADLLVVNHHLLLADLAMRQEGVAEFLPSADAVVVDEAHQLPEVAGQFFGVMLGGRQLVELARDSLSEHLRAGGKLAERPTAATELELAVRRFRLALGDEPRRSTWDSVALRESVEHSLEELTTALESLRTWLSGQGEESRGLVACRIRAERLAARVQSFRGDAKSTDAVRWFECSPRSFTLWSTPLDLASQLGAALRGVPSAWIFTSATLSVRGDFQHFTERLGLVEPRTLALESPFDYPHQALLYHPEGLPDPNHPDYTRAVVEAAVPVLRASAGRAFMLFTSHRALQQAAELLAERLDFPLLVQGVMPRTQLLERFRASCNGVLLGTSSFWEGVDVRGDALSCVIIDRLPFAAPGDPVLAARIDAMRRLGRDPFRDFQLPAAVITLKQGVGRLIRDVNDRGVMVICDPRLLTRNYGRVFLDSLPPMTRTRRAQRVTDFLDAAKGRHVESHP